MPLMLNTVHLAGNLTRDPECKTIATDRMVATFGIAINRRYKGADGQQKEDCTFVEVECWGRQAELVGQYLNKGRNCMIEGSLQYHKWTDKNGNNRSQLRVLAQRVHFIGGNSEQGNNAGATRSANRVADEPMEMVAMPATGFDDDPPF